jgi:hypothetical protein
MKNKTKSSKESDFTRRKNDLRMFWLFKLGILHPNGVPENLRAEVDAATSTIYFMTEELSKEACRTKGRPELAHEAWSKTYDALSKANFRGESLLRTYTRSIARNETSDLLKKVLKNPHVELEDDTPIPCQVLGCLFDDENFADILFGRPELQKYIIKKVISYEDDRRGRRAVPSQEKVIEILVGMGYKRHQIKNAWKMLRKNLAKDYHCDPKPRGNKVDSGKNSPDT